MPTGYTDNIKDGITFEQFVFQCSKAFGMGDPDSLSSDIPVFTPSTYYMDNLIACQKDMDDLKATSVECAQSIADREYSEKMEAFQTRLTEMETLKEKYESMLDSVEKWIPPTDEHITLKTFMIQQLTLSIRYDCNIAAFIEYQSPKKLSGQAWLDKKIERLKSEIEYYEAENKKEIIRIGKRNAWVEKLRESLKEK